MKTAEQWVEDRRRTLFPSQLGADYFIELFREIQNDASGIRTENEFTLLPCKFCGKVPAVPKLWTDASGSYSDVAILFCGCGINVSCPLKTEGWFGAHDAWDIIQQRWERALGKAMTRWNFIMKPV